MDSGMRFAGQEEVLSLINSTTGDPMLPDVGVEQSKVGFPLVLVKKDFLGEIGPDYREFGDGYEVSFKFQHSDADSAVSYLNQVLAKAQGASVDEFALSMKFVSPVGGTFRVVLLDLHFENVGDLDMGSRTNLMDSEMKAKGKKFKIKKV